MIPRIFCGFDQREAAGWHAFAQSVLERASEPVALIPFGGEQRVGETNAFGSIRFLVPYFCDFSGQAIFVDAADMICMADIVELWNLRKPGLAVQVVKHKYETRHPRKYVGTEMEAENASYPCKNWSSVMIFDCGHYLNRKLTPAYVAERPSSYFHRFEWLNDPALSHRAHGTKDWQEFLGELPAEWNWIPEEQGANTKAKLIHFSIGIPGIRAYARTPHAQAWFHYHARAQETPAEKRIAALASQR